jgi:hypothetical protein
VPCTAFRIPVVTLVLALTLRSTAHARMTLKTAPVTPRPGGSVHCKVVASGKAPIGLVARIMTRVGADADGLPTDTVESE